MNRVNTPVEISADLVMTSMAGANPTIAAGWMPERQKIRATLIPKDSRRWVSGEPIQYQPVAVISQHGKTIGDGHYTAKVLQEDERWVYFDGRRPAENIAIEDALLNKLDAPCLVVYRLKIPQTPRK